MKNILIMLKIFNLPFKDKIFVYNIKLFLLSVLQRRGAGEVRPGAEVRAGAAAGGSPHPPARCLQRPQLGQQGEGGAEEG